MLRRDLVQIFGSLGVNINSSGFLSATKHTGGTWF